MQNLCVIVRTGTKCDMCNIGEIGELTGIQEIVKCMYCDVVYQRIDNELHVYPREDNVCYAKIIIPNDEISDNLQKPIYYLINYETKQQYHMISHVCNKCEQTTYIHRTRELTANDSSLCIDCDYRGFIES